MPTGNSYEQANWPMTQNYAKMFLQQIRQPPPWAQALNVVGEAGEFAEAFRRLTGNARRPGSLDEVGDELADVIISAVVMAELMGLDAYALVLAKWEKIFTRGFGGQTNV